MVREDHDEKAALADETALSTSALVESATVAICVQSDGERTGRYFSTTGRVLVPEMKLLITVGCGLSGIVWLYYCSSR